MRLLWLIAAKGQQTLRLPLLVDCGDRLGIAWCASIVLFKALLLLLLHCAMNAGAGCVPKKEALRKQK